MSEYHLTWICDGVAVGRAPMSYEDLDAIRKASIGAIVNLCGELCDLPQIEEDAGFEVVYLPVCDDEPPNTQALEEALCWLEDVLCRGKKVLIHCHLGVGRTGTFAMAYLMRGGCCLKTAEEQLKQTRCCPTSYSQWKFLRKYEKQQKERREGG